MRSRLIAAIGLAIALSAVPSSAGEFTTFQAHSEGCSGGGERCGSFPLLPLGTADYEHAARADGTLDVMARTERGLPPVCSGSTCAPQLAAYHAEAAAAVWVEADAPSASSVSVSIDYLLDELAVESEAIVGTATGDVTGALTVTEATGAPSASCSDGSAVLGRLSIPVDLSSELGQQVIQTTITCEGDGAVLSATRWRIELRIRVTTTSRGGTAEARAAGALERVTVL